MSGVGFSGGASNLFGRDDPQVHSGGWFGGQPPLSDKPASRVQSPVSPKVEWARRVVAAMKSSRQRVTEEMRRNTSLAEGGTPWWRDRAPWKIGTKLNYAATIPLTWTAILTDAKPSVSYSALDRTKQKRADIATAAWNQASSEHNWDQQIHNAVLLSRIQKKAYLSLRPKLKGDQIVPILKVIPGLQVYMDENATGTDDAEIIYYEYRESYGSLVSRFPGLAGKLQRKYAANEKQQNDSAQSILMQPTTYTMPTGTTTYNPAYAASPNPPDSADGTAGFMVQEFWTRPHKTIEVEEIRFLTTGEPATEPKMFRDKDGNEEPLRRIITEGGVIYELPESLVGKLILSGVIKVLSNKPALKALSHKVKYPLYPEGRLMVIVDEDIDADDRMNPLGYFPFAEVQANAALNGGQYGPSDVDLIADVYEQLVRFVSLIYDNANLAGNAIWRIPIGSEISNDDITNAPGSIQREDIQTLKFGKREGAPDMPNYIMNMLKFLTDQIKELSGLSDMMTGKMPSRPQISTETMTQAQDASGVRFRDSLANLSRCMRTLGAHFLQFSARFYQNPVWVQLKNDQGIPEPVPFIGTYLTDPFIVEAKAGSRQPAGPSSRLNTLLNLKNAGVVVDAETIYTLLEELGSIQSSTGLMRRIEQLMKDPRQHWKLLGLAPPQQPKKPGSKRQRKGAAAA